MFSGQIWFSHKYETNAPCHKRIIHITHHYLLCKYVVPMRSAVNEKGAHKMRLLIIPKV